MPHSLPAQALTLGENGGEVLYSPPVLQEIGQVLARPKFQPYISDDDIAGTLARIDRAWRKITVIHTVRACRDRKDDKFLEVAVNGGADFIVTGDKDLLDMEIYEGVVILSPADFIKRSQV